MRSMLQQTIFVLLIFLLSANIFIFFMHFLRHLVHEWHYCQHFILAPLETFNVLGREWMNILLPSQGKGESTRVIRRSLFLVCVFLW